MLIVPSHPQHLSMCDIIMTPKISKQWDVIDLNYLTSFYAGKGMKQNPPDEKFMEIKMLFSNDFFLLPVGGKISKKT